MSYKVDPRETSFFQPAVEDKDLTSPPAYSKGKRYIVGAGATGAWNLKDNYIVDDNGAGWDFITPKEGMIVYIKDEDKFYKYISSWTELSPVETATTIATLLHAATDKTSFADNDEIPIIDSAASNVLKKNLWSVVKSTLKTYFDPLYQGLINILVNGGTVGTNGVGVIAIKKGTIPSSSPVDEVQLYADATDIAIDNMEYASDGAAQAAYVSNGLNDTYGSNVVTGGTATSNAERVGNPASLSADGNTATYLINDGVNGGWWKYDFGSGVTKKVRKLRFINLQNVAYCFGNFNFDGSNDNSNWTTISSGDGDGGKYEWQEFTFSNSTSYRYYRIIGTAGNDNSTTAFFMNEVEMMELNLHSLQSYSEVTIKTQGSYSLKGVAAITGSLNKTLTRTVSPVIDLTKIKTLKFDIYSSRTGANIKIGIHDSGGTTTEKTYTVLVANTQESVTWDISAVSDANKDAIDSIIITILNADAENIFYIDNFYSVGLAECRVRDEAGNITTISPHNFKNIPKEIIEMTQIESDGMAWSYHSEKGKKEITVDMFNAVKDLEKITGKKYIYTDKDKIC